MKNFVVPAVTPTSCNFRKLRKLFIENRSHLDGPCFIKMGVYKTWKFFFIITQLSCVLRHGSAVSYSEEFCAADGVPELADEYFTNPDNCETFSTCSGHCGLVQQLMGDDHVMRCSCDQLCTTYGDCCGDFKSECPTEYSEAVDIMARYDHSSMTISCDEVIPLGFPNPLVVSCKYDATACTKRPDNPIDEVPVTDLDTGLDFVNARCAACNRVRQGQVWPAEVVCEYEDDLPNRNGSTNATVVTSEDVIQSITRSYCALQIERPESRNELRRCDYEVTSSCPSECDNEALIQACHNSSQNTVYDVYSRNYANPYCALCSSTTRNEDKLTCGHEAFQKLGFAFWEYNFAVLFKYDASSNDGVSLPGDRIICPDGQQYINEAIGCRPVLHNSPFQSKEEIVVVTVKLETDNNANASHIEYIVQDYGQTLCPLINETVRENFQNISEIRCDNERNSSFEGISMKVIITWLTELDLLTSLNSNGSVERAIQNIAYNATYVFDPLLERGWILNVSVNGRNYVPDRRTLSCAVVSFHENEYSVLNNSAVKILSSGQRITTQDYTIHDKVLYVCAEALDRDKRKPENNTEERILSILTLICMILSGLFLIARIILQFIIPLFKTVPMQLQFYYCIALLASVILFFLSPLFRDYETPCLIIAVLKHYAFLAAFAWMSVIAVDMYKMFRSFSGMQKAAERAGCKDIIVQHMLAWGIPACIVAITVIVDYTPPDEHNLKPDYGEKRCWLSPETYAILVFFGVPIFVAVILNIILFVLVFLKLRKAFKRRTHMTNDTQSNWSTYLRLFILMGVSCGFLLLTPFVDHIALWILIILTSAGQGIYIGAVSLFNKQVLTYIRDKIGWRFTSDSEKPTKDTALSSSQAKSPNLAKNQNVQQYLGKSTNDNSLELTNRSADAGSEEHRAQSVASPRGHSPVTSERDGLLGDMSNQENNSMKDNTDFNTNAEHESTAHSISESVKPSNLDDITVEVH